MKKHQPTNATCFETPKRHWQHSWQMMCWRCFLCIYQ